MIRKILLFPEPILSDIAVSITPLDDKQEILDVCQDLIDTVKARHEGIRAVGLAAPQIGVPKRIIVIDYMQYKDLIMINPVMTEGTGRMKHDEMCLSFPKQIKRKTRKQYIKVDYLDSSFNQQSRVFTALAAFIVQHEIDHLNGVTLND